MASSIHAVCAHMRASASPGGHTRVVTHHARTFELQRGGGGGWPPTSLCLWDLATCPYVTCARHYYSEATRHPGDTHAAYTTRKRTTWPKATTHTIPARIAARAATYLMRPTSVSRGGRGINRARTTRITLSLFTRCWALAARTRVAAHYSIHAAQPPEPPACSVE